MTALSSLDHDRDELTHILSQMNDILSIKRLSYVCPTDQVAQNGPEYHSPEDSLQNEGNLGHSSSFPCIHQVRS